MWGRTPEVCGNDGYENLTNVLVVFLAASQRRLNLCPDETCHPYFEKREREREKSSYSGGMYNVMAIISSIITTIKLKS